MGFFGNIQEKTQQLKEKTQNSRQKLKVSAKSKTRFAENASKKKPDLYLLLQCCGKKVEKPGFCATRTNKVSCTKAQGT